MQVQSVVETNTIESADLPGLRQPNHLGLSQVDRNGLD